VPEPIATWNSARGVWERPELNMLCGHAVPFSETWPTSFMTLGGRLYPLPTQGHRTAVNESSSSPGLLPTPRTADGMNSTMGANRERMARHQLAGTRAWRGTIEEAVSLLPTPNATDYKGAGQPPGRIRDGRERPASDADLPSAIQLLPTPEASDGTGGRMSAEMGGQRPSGSKRAVTVATAVGHLLKTPTAQLAVNGGSQDPEKRKAGGHGPTLADQVEHQLLPTPTAADGDRMSMTYPRGNPTLIGSLLPTPRATDGTHGGPNQRGSSGDFMLPSAVMELLPTPRASDTGTPGRRASEGFRPPLSQVLLPTPRVTATRTSRGAIINSRSAPSLDQAMELAAGIVPRELENLNEAPPSWHGEPMNPPSADGSGQLDGQLLLPLSLDEPARDFPRGSSSS